MNTVKFSEVKDRTNLVHLRGNLTADPEVRTFPGGGAVAKFSIAHNRTYEVSGVKKEEVTYIDVDYSGNDVLDVGKFLRKGTPVALRAQAHQDRWDDKTSGAKRSKVVLKGYEIAEVIFAPKEGQDERKPTGFASTVPFDQLKQDGFDSNSVWLVGNLTANPEVTALPSGTQVADFSIGVHRTVQRDGQPVEETSYFDFSAWGEQIKDVQALAKGEQVAVRGAFRQDTWEKDGQKRTKTKINAFEIVKIEKQQKRDQSPAESQALPKQREQSAPSRGR